MILIKYLKILTISALLVQVPALALPLRGFRAGGEVNIESLKLPDDVTAYTKKLEQCYKIKNEPTTNQTNIQPQLDALGCQYLSNESARMRNQYYGYPNIINFIQTKENNFPF
jgi:hypothetical protein